LGPLRFKTIPWAEDAKIHRSSTGYRIPKKGGKKVGMG